MSDTADNVVDFKPSKLRALVSTIVDRLNWARQAGISFNGARDLYAAFGYSRDLSIKDFADRYDRGGIAGRIVDALPYATWRGGVELIEDHDAKNDTSFEAAWAAFAKRCQVGSRFLQADVMSRIGVFSVLLIGGRDSVDTELPRGNGTTKGIEYLRAFLGSGGPNSNRLANNAGSFVSVDANIDSFETDIHSPRFGEPVGYRIRTPVANNSAELNSRIVHWSRVIHVAERALYDEVYGEPALQRPWNLLDDLEKVTGGGAEAYFQRVNGGRVWSLDKDIANLGDDEKTAMAEQIEKLQHGMQRDIRMRGVNVQELGSSIAEFGPNADAILTQIAGTTAIPKRILTGSEMGELASTQDRENWRDQVNGRRQGYAGPMILERLVDRLIAYNYLPTPKKYEAVWGSVMNLTEDEKQKGAQSWATTNRMYGSTVFLDDEIRATWYNKDPLPPEVKQQNVAPIPADLKAAEEAFWHLASLPRLADANDKVHTGLMVAIPVPKDVARQLAQPDGVPATAMHVTLCYCGVAKEMSAEEIDKVFAAVQDAVSALSSFSFDIEGDGRFAASPSSDGKDVIVAKVYGAELYAVRAAIYETLKTVGCEPNNNFEYIPHVTLTHVDPTSQIVPNVPTIKGIKVTALQVSRGKTDALYGLGGQPVSDAPLVAALADALQRDDQDAVRTLLEQA